MANPNSVDELRSLLTAARQVAEEAQDAVDAESSDYADLPQRIQAALDSGDGAQFALLQERQTGHPARLYFAKVTLLKAQQAVVEAERAVLEAELAPYLAKHEELSAAFAKAAAAQAANGNEIETRKRRMRLLTDLKRGYADKLEALRSDYTHSALLERAPVVRSLPHMARI